MSIHQRHSFQLWHLLPELLQGLVILRLEGIDHLSGNVPHRVRFAVPVAVVPQGLPFEIKETPALTELPVRVPSVDVDVPDRQLASEVAADVPLGLLRPFSRFRQKVGKAVFQMILL